MERMSLGGWLAVALCGCGSPTVATSSAPTVTVTATAPTATLSTEAVGLPSALTPHARAQTEVIYLDAGGTRYTLTIDGATGTLVDEVTGVVDTVESATLLPSALSFVRRSTDGSTQWYALRRAAGVVAGRFGAGATLPPVTLVGGLHVSGWEARAFEAESSSYTWELALADGRLARLRLGRGGHREALVGRIKIYASLSAGALDESYEHDLVVAGFDGRSVTATEDTGQVLSAAITGRRIAGSLAGVSFTGTRAEVLGYGLRARADRAQWQSLTRARIALLMMAGAPTPRSTSVVDHGPRAPLPSTNLPPRRDDNADAYPQAYHLHELDFSTTLPGPTDGITLTRQAHGYLAVPTSAAPAGGYPVVLALNGHSGSARSLFNPDDEYFHYGDAWARRGYLVIAVDIGHRALADRAALYSDVLDGDAPADGNGAHPALAAPGLDSDWEEDGERTFDAMRALDYVLARGDVNPGSVIATGLSMGGEITTWMGALDTRVSVAVPAGFSPDMGVMIHHGNHPCWQWQHADVREYLDVSDLHALTAPRPLVVETGAIDGVFSFLIPPFAADKQDMRRTRAAYADAPARALHYLHDDVHHYHFGDLERSTGLATGVRATVEVVPQATVPAGASPWQYQINGSTEPASPSLFTLVAGWLS